MNREPWFDVSFWNESTSECITVLMCDTGKEVDKAVKYAMDELMEWRILKRWVTNGESHAQYLAWSCKELQPYEAVLY